MNRKYKSALLRAALLCLACALILAGGLRLLDWAQQKEYREGRGSGTTEFMQSSDVIYQGVRYRKTPNVSVLLIAGIDLDGNRAGVSTSRYRSGGQADFLLLLAVDHTHRQIHQLQIDRDTMADVTVLSVYGRETGKRRLQICLAHSYGATKEDQAKYTVRAVRGLMNSGNDGLGMDLAVDGYYMFDYTAIPSLNDALGGVTVTIPEDMTSVDAEWTEGSVVTLQGKKAETFVRTRQTVGEGTNRERMSRQSIYMDSMIRRMHELVSDDKGFATHLLSKLKKDAVTDLSDQQLVQEINEASAYEVLPVEYLEGTYGTDDGGFVTFEMKENSAFEWILKHLYTKES